MDSKVLIEILERCIEQFGTEWSQGSDDYFWWVADIQSRLQNLLWACPVMWHTWGEQINGTTRQRKVPLIHLETPAAKAPTAKKRQRYDLALYEPVVAQRMVTQHLIPGVYPGDAKEERVLAVVEIAQAHSPLKTNSKNRITEAFDRLVSNIDQIDHGYLLIPVTAYSNDKKWPEDLSLLQDDKHWIEREKRKWCTGTSPNKVKVYWVSDHPQDTARWIVGC
jgi:hypothetical protein